MGGEEKSLLEENHFNKDMKSSKQVPDHKVYTEIYKPPITRSLLKNYKDMVC